MDEEYVWAYTCTKPEFFELTLMYLPDFPFKNLTQMLICCPKALVSTLEEIALRVRPKWPIRFILDEWVDRDFVDDYEHALREYSLRHKLLMPVVIGERNILFTDDDVIVQRDPHDLIQSGAFWSSMSFDRLSLSEADRRELEVLNEVFSTNIRLDEFNACRTDAGIWYFHNTQPKKYEALLRSYFDHPWNLEVIRGTSRHRPRYRDQRFLTMYFHEFERGLRNTADVRIWGSKFEKRSPKTRMPNETFIHYAASSQKPLYVEYLREHAPKGDA